ncbi:hypothetical protein LINGRAHAP2_LOCUS5611, partial [Linum grandiflorum]
MKENRSQKLVAGKVRSAMGFQKSPARGENPQPPPPPKPSSNGKTEQLRSRWKLIRPDKQGRPKIIRWSKEDEASFVSALSTHHGRGRYSAILADPTFLRLHKFDYEQLKNKFHRMSKTQPQALAVNLASRSNSDTVSEGVNDALDIPADLGSDSGSDTESEGENDELDIPVNLPSEINSVNLPSEINSYTESEGHALAILANLASGSNPSSKFQGHNDEFEIEDGSPPWSPKEEVLFAAALLKHTEIVRRLEAIQADDSYPDLRRFTLRDLENKLSSMMKHGIVFEKMPSIFDVYLHPRIITSASLGPSYQLTIYTIKCHLPELSRLMRGIDSFLGRSGDDVAVKIALKSKQLVFISDGLSINEDFLAKEI